MKNPATLSAGRRAGPRIDSQNHNARSVSQPTAFPQRNSRAPLSEAQLKLLDPARFCSGLPEAFLSGCPPLVPDVDRGGAP
jgi:hypothetical protein